MKKQHKVPFILSTKINGSEKRAAARTKEDIE